ncbi:hypothetical protein PsorP6_018783 [Peronosclerospora sorghi]|nr:hypothetical protein PsorP6_018783 [Peronosclerospora sorghi]
MMLRRRDQQHVGNVGEMMENLKLFIDCIEVLNLSVDDIYNDNADILLALRHLRRLNVQFKYANHFLVYNVTITTLDLAYVQIKPEGYRMLVAMVREMPHLLQLSVTDFIGVFGKKLLVDSALRVPTLERILIRSNLDDNAFDGLA